MRIKITDTNRENLGDYEDEGFIEGTYVSWEHLDYSCFGIEFKLKDTNNPEYTTTIMEYGFELPTEYISIDLLKFLDNLKTPKQENEHQTLKINFVNGILNSYEYSIRKEIYNGK